MLDQVSFQIYNDQDLPFQYHQSMFVFFGISGVCHVWRSASLFDIAPAGLLVIDPYELSRVSADAGAKLLGLKISHQFLQFAGWNDSMASHCYAFDAEGEDTDYDRIREIYAQIFQEYFQNGEQQAAHLNSLILRLIGLIQTGFVSEHGAQRKNDETAHRLKRLLDRIHGEWNTDLSLSELAESEYMSASYLSRYLQKYLNVPFTQYLTALRLRHAAQMLTRTGNSVTQIAADCGFGSSSIFISAFRKQYGVTPGQYRSEQESLRSQQAAGLSEMDTRLDISVLMEYLPRKEPEAIPNRTQPVTVDTANVNGSFKTLRILNIGYARDGLLAPVQEQIKRAQNEIGFSFLRFHGIFDEDMHVYREESGGNPRFDFTYVGLLFDFILSVGIKPYIEFGFMPAVIAREQTRIFDRSSVISGCTDLGKWQQLVGATMRFFISRYGREEVLSWRFTTICMSYVHIGCIKREDFEALYRCTRDTVKVIDKRLSFGGPGCFAEYVPYADGLDSFLAFAKEKGCVPDFITIQSYPHVNAADPLFMDYTLSQASAPAILSEDPSFMLHALEKVEDIIDKSGMQGTEIDLIECNSTLWQRDLSSETIYKAVWLAKNICETYDRAVFGYWLLTDLMEERASLESVFHGGYGLFTYNGIPKAGYQVLRLMSRMGNDCIARGS